MIHLPALADKTRPRPNRPDFEQSYLIPDTDTYADLWDEVYQFLRAVSFRSPVVRSVDRYVNRLFGFFGFRVHPVTKVARYFHVGLSLDLARGRKVYPIYPGVLEYAGYGAVNGYYILLSHPDIVTDDGYVLHSMYCHLKKPLVTFTSYQKMLREISLGSHPIISVPAGTLLGTAATSGLSRQHKPGLYFEVSFRKFGENPIAIDPYRLYHDVSPDNETKDLVDPDTIVELFG